MSGKIDEKVSHDTHKILNDIGMDIFLCDSYSARQNKLDAYEKCFSEIKKRLDDEAKAKVDAFWRVDDESKAN